MSSMIRIAAIVAAAGGLAISLPPRASAREYEAGQIVVMLQPGYIIGEVNAHWGTVTLDAYPE